MARQPRLDVPGAIYHVIARGNRRATIFHDEADYRAYLNRLERYRQRDGLTVHAYARQLGSGLSIDLFHLHPLPSLPWLANPGSMSPVRSIT